MTGPAGFAFPFRIADGRVAMAGGADKTAADLRHLITTRLGERPMLRGYGTAAHAVRHEPNDPASAALLAHDLATAIRDFMPGLRLTGAPRVSHDGDTLRVRVDYLTAPGVPARVEVVA
jgi:phage baseplate assembly protein W